MRLDFQPQNAPETTLGIPDLAALIGRIARKEPAALMALYDATGSLFFGMALRILGDRVAAEETLLDVYTQVWKRSASYNEKRCTSVAWIADITRDRAIERLRSGRREWKAQNEKIGIEKYAPSDKEGPLALSAQKGLIQSAIEALPSDQWNVIELGYYYGLNQTEIAARLQQPMGAVRTRARLGMTRLSEALKPSRPTMETDKKGTEH
jgi:RNA polymerase sigma-70 factor (ECF subfamily)